MSEEIIVVILERDFGFNQRVEGEEGGEKFQDLECFLKVEFERFVFVVGVERERRGVDDSKILV